MNLLLPNDKFQMNDSISEISYFIQEGREQKLHMDDHRTCYNKAQLELDIQQLRKKLDEEVVLHSILESAMEQAAVSLFNLSCVPHETQELLANIAKLEATISELEQKVISMHFQISQERNERRLAEYWLKNSASSSLLLNSAKNDEQDSAAENCVPVSEERDLRHKFPSATTGKIKREMSVKGLWNYPNLLSEEMVRCMKNIFISLADSSAVSCKVSGPANLESPISPHGHLWSSSLSSLSEPSKELCWVHNPQIELHHGSNVLATETAFDPYRKHGRRIWADIGYYGLAIEVSWMSVGKKQLEYAAGALRRFRLFIEQLTKVNPAHLSNNEKLAFWINIYNALIMHAYLAYGVPRSDLKLFSLMQKAAYTVGGYSFNAAAIEYVILKMKPPVHRPQTALLLALHKLKVSDEQRKFSIDTPEPLLTFALSCGFYSSPAVRIYTATNVRDELLEAQRDYIRASVGISNKGKLLVPKMLHCFVRGFIDDSDLAVWVIRFLPPQQVAFVKQCLSRRRQKFLGSRNCAVLPFDSSYRYLFLPENLPRS